MRRLFATSVLLLGCGSGAETTPVTDSAVVVEDVGAEAAADVAVEDARPAPPHPTPEELSFRAVSPLPAGEQLLFNDWTASPNAVYSIKPDGTGETEVFRVFRVWSMGVAHGANKIAFSSADPKQ